jgi:ketosteroid isomerase-like protein
MSQQNVELAHQLYAAFNRRDIDAFLEIMAADVQAFPRQAAMEGGYRGHAGIRRWWADLLAVFPDFAVEVIEVRDLGAMTLSALRFLRTAQIARRRSMRRSGRWGRYVTGRASGGASTGLRTKHSKPQGCGRSRWRMQTWRL